MDKQSFARYTGKVGEYTLQVVKTASWYNRWLFSNFKGYLDGEILEVGAGIGNLTKLLLEKGEVTAIDYKISYLNKLKKIKVLGRRPKVGWGDIEKGRYFFSNKSFDCVVCTNVLEHIEDDLAALKNIFKLLKRGGRLILLVPFSQFAYGEIDKGLGHYRRYSKGEIEDKIKKAGFKLESIKYLNFLGIIGWFLNSKVFKRDTLPKNQLKLFNLLSRPFLYIERFVEAPIGLSILAICEK